MRLSPVFLDAARRGEAVFVVVKAKTKVSLPSPTGGVDQRKPPSWQARTGALERRKSGKKSRTWRLKKSRGHGVKPARPGLCYGQGQ
jgi:hypothetical protein